MAEKYRCDGSAELPALTDLPTQAAGLGTIGRHFLLITPEFGSRFVGIMSLEMMNRNGYGELRIINAGMYVPAILGGKIMSKYDALWEYVQKNGSQSFCLTFEEIQNIAGIPIDHSFLKYKKELAEYGYQVGKISMKEQTVIFNKAAE